MSKVLDPVLEKRLDDGIASIRSDAPTTQQDRDELLAALAELQLKKQQASCIGFGRFKATGAVTWLIVIVTGLVLYFSLPYLADILRACKSKATAPATEVQPLEVPSK